MFFNTFTSRAINSKTRKEQILTIDFYNIKYDKYIHLQ